ncbi:MAG: aminotransferase class I/II-fold pyridoxal phosphate-dependent enzyme [Candidatus Omnitrophica bacterium]|nr:aminotransferase class I/II-fold pyridoxal phosphate-dependent enzyme [Candidatus Omnitrophota bacterium]
MQNNISASDLDAAVKFLKTNPVLTQSENVGAFEREWSKWLGVKYSVMVNSGSSANLVTMAALREIFGTGEIIVPPLTWVSDIASVIQCGFKPVFADINPRTLGLDESEVLEKITKRTKAVFLTHILGYNALSQKLLDGIKKANVLLIEDACESHGAAFRGKKVGSFGHASNFSFYYAHHLTTIEGGMVSTNDRKIYETVRMLRSHGLVRESASDKLKSSYRKKFPDLNPEFIFAFPAYNVRSAEINAVIGRSHLKRLDGEIKKRNRNLRFFLTHLDVSRYRTDFALDGASNYAFTLVLREPDPQFSRKVTAALDRCSVEYRRGTSGGGNQLRQPYLRRLLGNREHKKFPNTEHIHFYGFYIGNYPGLPLEKIKRLCEVLNGL